MATDLPTLSEPNQAGSGRTESLDPRVIPLRRVSGLLFTAVVGGVSLIALAIHLVAAGPGMAGTLMRVALWAAAIGLLAWHSLRWPAIDYRHTSYRVDDRGMEIRRGVFWRAIVNVPRSRIQHTDVSQGPLERRYGLGTLVVYTAGTDYARVSLPGLEHGTAMRIREHLLPTGDSGAV